jgi:hypothetical protein
LHRTCFLQHVTGRRVGEKTREEEVEVISGYLIILRKREEPGVLKKKR